MEKVAHTSDVQYKSGKVLLRRWSPIVGNPRLITLRSSLHREERSVISRAWVSDDVGHRDLVISFIPSHLKLVQLGQICLQTGN